MKKNGRKWPSGARDGIALLVAGVIAGCYPKAGPAPGPVSASGVARASARWPGTTAESLTAGHDLFIENCNRCHDYPDLTAVAEEKWPGILEQMANKAGLSDAQRDLVLHFVLTARSEQSTKS